MMKEMKKEMKKERRKGKKRRITGRIFPPQDHLAYLRNYQSMITKTT